MECTQSTVNRALAVAQLATPSVLESVPYARYESDTIEDKCSSVSAFMKR